MTVNIIHIVVLRRLHEVNPDSRGPVPIDPRNLSDTFVLIVEFYLSAVNSCVQREPDVLEKIWCCRILTKPFRETNISLTPNKMVFFSRKRRYLTQKKKKGDPIPYFCSSRSLPSPTPSTSPTAPLQAVLMNYNSPTSNSFEKCFKMFFLSIFTMLCTSSCFNTSEEFKLHRVGF